MNFYHQHNLVDPEAAQQDRMYGIRVTLPANDTLRKVVGDHWERLLWYPSEESRDRAMAKMAARHGYYRDSDTPTQVLEKVSR